MQISTVYQESNGTESTKDPVLSLPDKPIHGCAEWPREPTIKRTEEQVLGTQTCRD